MFRGVPLGLAGLSGHSLAEAQLGHALAPEQAGGFEVLPGGLEESGSVPPGTAEAGHLCLQEELIALLLGAQEGGLTREHVHEHVVGGQGVAHGGQGARSPDLDQGQLGGISQAAGQGTGPVQVDQGRAQQLLEAPNHAKAQVAPGLQGGVALHAGGLERLLQEVDGRVCLALGQPDLGQGQLHGHQAAEVLTVLEQALGGLQQ